MEDLSEGLAEERLLHSLGDFGIAPATTTYAPVGFGDYHWKVTGADGRRWFATVADLEHKEHCGDGAVAALTGLRRAMDTAVALREREGLRFVVAPLRATNGETVVPLDARYALSVFPVVRGTPGHFGQKPTPQEHDQILDLLADLHSRTPPETTPMTVLDPAGRGGVDTAPREPVGEWRGGPFSEPARDLFAENVGLLHARLEEFDQLAEEVRRRGAPRVVTHGEPHLGNLILGDDGYLLVDWDTVGLAVPERDLSVLSDSPLTLARYAEVTGRTPDAAALALYRLRWSLVGVAEFITWFRGSHSRTSDTEAAWQGFTETLDHLLAPLKAEA
ncbi:MAG: phosphotransferase [Pseudonocardiaceae bacterium]